MCVVEKSEIKFMLIKDVQKGDELCICYGWRYVFQWVEEGLWPKQYLYDILKLPGRGHGCKNQKVLNLYICGGRHTPSQVAYMLD